MGSPRGAGSATLEMPLNLCGRRRLLPRARKNDKDADLPPKQRPGSKGCVGHAFPPLPFGLPAREEAPRLRAATGSRFCSLGTFPGHETPRTVSPRVPHPAGVSVPSPGCAPPARGSIRPAFPSRGRCDRLRPGRRGPRAGAAAPSRWASHAPRALSRALRSFR